MIGGLSEGNVQLSTAIIGDVTETETRSKSLALIGIAFSVCFTFGYVPYKLIKYDADDQAFTRSILCITTPARVQGLGGAVEHLRCTSRNHPRFTPYRNYLSGDFAPRDHILEEEGRQAGEQGGH